MDYDLGTLPGRIRWAIREIGGFATWADFARAADIAHDSVVRRWVAKDAETRGVDDDSLRLVEEHTGVPASWLRFGGAMPMPVTDTATPSGRGAVNGRSELATELAAIREMDGDDWLKAWLYAEVVAGFRADAMREAERAAATRALAALEAERGSRARADAARGVVTRLEVSDYKEAQTESKGTTPPSGST